MAKRQEAQGRTLGSIIELEDGKRILVKVKAIRETDGEYKGHLIDCETMSGDHFSINGHTILVDKLSSLFTFGNDWFDIFRDGKIGRAVNYRVERVEGSDEALSNDPEEQQLITWTNEYVSSQIAALPPRD